MRWIAAAVLLLSSLAFPSLSALIVYVSDYDSEAIIDLPAAQKDAIKMKSFLQTLPDSHVSLLENPTAGQLIRTFKKWASVEADTKIFYYAGHGISKGGEFYFIPADADPEDEYTWVPFGRLKGYVPAGVKVVWLIDACYSGSMIKGRPLGVLRIQKEALSITGNEVIITSSSGNEISREMADGSGGIFTAVLVEGLKGAADEDGDGWIESGELYEYVKKKVEKLSMGQQHPVMKGGRWIRIVANLSGKLKELDRKLFDLYFAGKLSELQYRNMNALIEGRSCSGEGVDKLKKGIDDYLAGKMAFEALVEYVVKVYAGKISCSGVIAEERKPEGGKMEEEYTPKGTAFLNLIPENELAKGAKVYIDGKYAGRIEGDIFSVEVEAGKHKVLITGEKIEDMEFEMSVEEYEEYTKEISAKPAKRVVKITTDPAGASVYVNGEYVGRAPKFLKLEVGKRYEVKILKAGYKPLKKTFLIPSKGGVVEKSYKLQKGKIGIIWQKALGGGYDDVAFSIQQTSDGGYIVAGYTYSNDGDVSGYHDDADFWVVKLDERGNIIWQKALGGSGRDEAYSVQQTSDGGYIVAGYTKSNDGDVSGYHGRDDFWVVKLGWK